MIHILYLNKWLSSQLALSTTNHSYAHHLSFRLCRDTSVALHTNPLKANIDICSKHEHYTSRSQITYNLRIGSENIRK